MDLKKIVADALEHAILNRKPVDIMTGHNEDWFHLKPNGSVFWNFRNGDYAASLICDELCATNEQFKQEYEILSTPYNLKRELWHDATKMALGRSSVKQYKEQCKKRFSVANADELTKARLNRITLIDRQIELLQAERAKLVEMNNESLA